MASHAMDGPQWDFGWKASKVNEYGDREQHLLHPDNPVPLDSVFVHAEGTTGMGITTPSGRDYGAVIEGTFEPRPTNDERKWGIGPRPGGTGYARNFRLRHVKEYTGLQETAQQLSDAVDFMDVTGSDFVSTENDKNTPEIDSTDLVNNLYEKRPEFPRNFKTPKRAMHVAELLIKRRDSNIPLTPRPRVSR
jgi:hypothetical protein